MQRGGTGGHPLWRGRGWFDQSLLGSSDEAALAPTNGNKGCRDLFDKRCRLMDAWAGYLETPPAEGPAGNLNRRRHSCQ
jgi:hypothetical protein